MSDVEWRNKNSRGQYLKRQILFFVQCNTHQNNNSPQAPDHDEHINSLPEALRAVVRAMIKCQEDVMAKMIMDEMRGLEEDAPNRPTGSVCSEYSESPEKQKTVLKEKSAFQPTKLFSAMTTPLTPLTLEEVNKMIEERFTEMERKRMGVPVINSNVALSLSTEIQNTQLPP
ncbi:hypothetical protein CRG98_005118 [Punica granatum]|uniref:Uncharacterized protein n=1 Tax=Punica granatum TaxID=22663 RepID=A0A2I0L1B1_PUNGR|nr:hypothetical protein CRG98_005118 [Punica granatum]